MAQSEFVEDAEAIATRVLYELLGRRWVFPYVTTTETLNLAPGQTALVMSGRPIVSVESVTAAGSSTPLAHTIENRHRIRLAKPLVAHGLGLSGLVYPTLRREGVCPPGQVTVRYTYGARPPAEVEYAIEQLAAELQLAMTEDEACRLPASVTSLQRQGISMTIDPNTFLEAGKTGIEEVDAMLTRYNPAKARRPARVFGRMTQPSARSNTTQN